MVNKNNVVAEVVIAGAGFSGLSAALFLGNARRKTVILAGGPTRNSCAGSMHNLLSHEGHNPNDIQQAGLDELSLLNDVQLIQSKARSITRLANNFFDTTLDNGGIISSRYIILAMGVTDILPDISGIHRLWPDNIFHCPYCIAPEVNNMPLAILSDEAEAIHMASIICKWTDDLVVLTNGQVLTRQTKHQLSAHNIEVNSDGIKSVVANEHSFVSIEFESGDMLSVRGIFIHLPFNINDLYLAQSLGCQINENGLIAVNETYETSQKGVYAIGDIAQKVQKISNAISSGTVAAFHLDHEISGDDWNRLKS